MRTLSTFSVLFWIYSQRAKDNLAVIYARITVNGRKLNISLKRKAEVNLWDSKKQRVIGKSAKSKELNQFLDQEYSRLFQCYQELRVAGKIISPESIKTRYFNGMDNLFSLEDMFKYHNENMFSKLKFNTSRLYITSQNYIRNFIKKEYGRKDFFLKELDYSFIIKFENYLRAVRPRHLNQVSGGAEAMTSGCSDGCTPWPTYWNCTEGDCSMDCNTVLPACPLDDFKRY